MIYQTFSRHIFLLEVIKLPVILFMLNIVPTNNQIIAPYLFEKKLVLEAIGKKQVNITLNIKEKDSQSRLRK